MAALTEDRLTQLDGIVSSMEAAGEPEENIRFVVDDFQNLYGAGQSPAATAGSALVSGAVDLLAKPFQALRNVQTTVGDLGQKYGGAPGRMLADTVTGGISNPLVTQFAADQASNLRAATQEAFPVDSERNPIAATIGGVVPQVAGMIGAGMALGPAAGLALMAPSEAEAGFEVADEVGLTSPEARLGMAGGFAGLGTYIERLGGIGAKQAVGSLVKRGLKGALSETLEEPATGAAQDLLTAAIGSTVLDPNNAGYTVEGYDLSQLDPGSPAYLKKRGLETLGGAVGGTLFAGVNALASRGQPAPGQPPPLPPSDFSGTAPAPISPLSGIAQRAGRVDVPPLVPGLESEDLGPLTAADVADLETPPAQPPPLPQVSPYAPPAAQVSPTVNESLTVEPPASVNAAIPTVPQRGPASVDTGIASSTPAAGALSPETSVAPETVPTLPEPQETPKQWAAQLGDATTKEEIEEIYRSNLSESPAKTKFNPGELTADRYGDDPFVYQNQFIDPNDFRDVLKLEGLTYDQVVQMPSTQRYIKWAKEGLQPPPVTVVKRYDGRMVISNRRRVVAALEAGITRLPAQVEIGKASEVMASLPSVSPAPVSESPNPQVSPSSPPTPRNLNLNPSGSTVVAVRNDGSTIIFNELIDLAARAVQRGVTFAQWAADTVRRLGASVRDYLESAWQAAMKNSQRGSIGGDPLNSNTAESNFSPLINGVAARLNEWAIKDADEDVRSIQFTNPDTAERETLGLVVDDFRYGMSDQAAFEYVQWLQTIPNPSENLRDAIDDIQWIAKIPNNRGGITAGYTRLNTSGTTAGFLNTDILNEAADLIRRGITNFTDWSRAMVTRFGRAIQEYLQGVWQAATTRTMPRMGGGRVTVRRPEGGFIQPAAGPSTPNAEPVTRETQARFASPDPNAFVYEVQGNERMLAEASAWLDGNTVADALTAMESNTPPAGLRIDHLPALGEQLLQRLAAATDQGTEIEQLQAEALLNRAGRAWQGQMSQEAGRTLQQRAAANARLLPIAPILAAKQVLVDRAEAVMTRRFEGGAQGVTRKMQDLNDRINKSLPRMLNALRLKMFPGMTWADIFTDLPSAQKERQREIYRRIPFDQRLQNLTPEQRLKLANDLDQAWMRERQKVFQAELKKAGVLGEKAAGDRARVEKALPKLMRMINLGMFNSEMWREAVAPEYGLRTLTTAQSRDLRKQAEAAWKQPEGVLRNQKMRELLEGIQRATGASKVEILNSYWTSAVLSGLRTQFDTWAAAINGFGTNLMQAGTLMARGRGRAAVEAHGQWWRGLYDGIRESGQILARGDTSYLKRFGADVNRALQGESGASPVPLGELLWKNGNKFQKYGLAPVMMFTGRLMAAADHVNNTATTQGAMAVARALHPELYGGKVAFTAAERANAKQQALREVTGGTLPTTSTERAQVSARTREILNGTINETQRMDASEIGDMAAFQNDPTGFFGTIYDSVKSGLGTAQRRLGAVAEDVEAYKAARGLTGLLAGSLHAITGTRFMRFGFNFGAELTRYMPGTYALGKAGFYGREVSRMQQELLLGKNVVGFMIASTLAALFVGDDDDLEDDTQWQIEGTWDGLTPEDKKQRMSAGLERMTMWRRKDGKVQRVSYKQWPSMALFAVVGGMKDEQRHNPKKFEQHGVTGHLLNAAGTGMLQIVNVSAMRNLADLFSSPQFGADPTDSLLDKITKTGTNYAGGLIPTVIKDIEIWNDPRNFKAEGVWEGLARSIPILRSSVNDGRPQLNALGEEVNLKRSPWSRTYTSVDSAEAHRVLGVMLSRGLSLPLPSSEVSVFQNGVKVPLESLGREAVWKYEKAVGTAYKEWLSDEGAELLKMPVSTLDKVIKRRASAIKQRALYKAQAP